MRNGCIWAVELSVFHHTSFWRSALIAREGRRATENLHSAATILQMVAQWKNITTSLRVPRVGPPPKRIEVLIEGSWRKVPRLICLAALSPDLVVINGTLPTRLEFHIERWTNQYELGPLGLYWISICVHVYSLFFSTMRIAHAWAPWSSSTAWFHEKKVTTGFQFYSYLQCAPCQGLNFYRAPQLVEKGCSNSVGVWSLDTLQNWQLEQHGHIPIELEPSIELQPMVTKFRHPPKNIKLAPIIFR